jgi:hypothetical protein
LVEAGASAEKAAKAAEELAHYESEFADVKADLRLLKWISTTHFAATLVILWRLFLH